MKKKSIFFCFFFSLNFGSQGRSARNNVKSTNGTDLYFVRAFIYFHSLSMKGERLNLGRKFGTSKMHLSVERLFLAVPWGCLQFVIVVFLDHTHYF